MKTKYIQPMVTVSAVKINNLMTLTGSELGRSGGNQKGQANVQFGKDRDDDYESDGWSDGLW